VKYIHESNVYLKVANKTMFAPKIFYDEFESINFSNKNTLSH
jgi:hypothetical protein